MGSGSSKHGQQRHLDDWKDERGSRVPEGPFSNPEPAALAHRPPLFFRSFPSEKRAQRVLQCRLVLASHLSAS
jgi:hypothetical protein